MGISPEPVARSPLAETLRFQQLTLNETKGKSPKVVSEDQPSVVSRVSPTPARISPVTGKLEVIPPSEQRSLSRERTAETIERLRRVGGLVDRWFHEKYCVEDLLGEGSQGQMYTACRRSDFEKVAIKIVDVTEDSHARAARRELDVLLACKGKKGILQILDHFVCTKTNRVAIVSEHHKTDLWKVMSDQYEATGEGIPSSTAIRISRQVAEAIVLVHKAGYCHRDLKAENILVDSEDLNVANVTLCDFGLAGDLLSPLTSACGSVDSGAPEVFFRDSPKAPYHGRPVDIWGVGVLLFSMVTGFVAWREAHKSDKVYQLWCERPDRFFKWCEKFLKCPLEDDFKTLFTHLCQHNPRDRMKLTSFDSILNGP